LRYFQIGSDILLLAKRGYLRIGSDSF